MNRSAKIVLSNKLDEMLVCLAGSRHGLLNLENVLSLGSPPMCVQKGCHGYNSDPLVVAFWSLGQIVAWEESPLGTNCRFM